MIRTLLIAVCICTIAASLAGGLRALDVVDGALVLRASGQPTRLTDPKTDRTPQVSSSGDIAVYTHQRKQEIAPSSNYGGSIRVIRANGSSSVLLETGAAVGTECPQKALSGEAQDLGYPQFSADERSVFVVDQGVSSSAILRVPLDGGKATAVWSGTHGFSVLIPVRGASDRELLLVIAKAYNDPSRDEYYSIVNVSSCKEISSHLTFESARTAARELGFMLRR